MADMLIMILLAAMALFVLVHIIGIAPRFSLGTSHPLRLTGLVMFYALSGAGGVAVALGAQIGGPILLAAVCMMLAADRRVR